MKAKFDPGVILLALVGFLTPILCGNVSTDRSTIEPGFGAAWSAALGGLDAPTFSHALCAALLGGMAIFFLLTRRVIQVPQNRLFGALTIFLAVIAGSIFVARDREVAMISATEWAFYGLAFLATIAGVGRRKGPIALITAISASITTLALLGFEEYLTNPDPRWRIFAHWTPNTQASIQVVGICLGIGLAISQTRKLAIYGVLATLASMGALILTQSRGGILSLLVGLVFLAVALVVLKAAPKHLPVVGRLALVGILAATLGPVLLAKIPPPAALQSEQTAQTSGGVLGRLENPGATSDQSVVFRKLLWISGKDLIKTQPVGIGMGNFLMYSAKPGLVTQTVTGHNSMLQLAVEASPLALIAFFAFAFFWLEHAMRGADQLPTDQNRLRMALIAAFLMVLVHSASESNLYTFGLGVTLFLIMGVVTQLAGDGSTPEYAPPAGKWMSAALIAFVSIFLLTRGWMEVLKANARYASRISRDVGALKEADESALSLVSDDAEAWYIHSILPADPKGQEAALQKACDYAPSPRYLRALAQVQMNQGELQPAEDTLHEAFRWDPNNFLAHVMMIQVLDAKRDHEAAILSARQFLQVESSPYYLYRSIPEMVPTETLWTRLFLARDNADPKARIDLLEPAVKGYKEYLDRTIHALLEIVKKDPANAQFAGENPREAIRKSADGVEACHLLSAAYRATGRGADADAVDKVAADLGAVAGALSVTK